MAKKSKKKDIRLPVRFHQTFIPEKKYITSLLRFAAGGGEGTDQEISAETGIPVGQSSGKVPAIISYSRGMGLIEVKKGRKSGQKRPLLTDFGRSVLLEDPNLSEAISQWIAHLHLCRRSGGAEIWHLTFGPASDILGMEFSEDQLEDYLSGIFGKHNRSLIGPMVRMYAEQEAFKTAGAIVREKSGLHRVPAPILGGFANGYAAFLLAIWERHFPQDRQVTLTDFEAETFWQRIAGWNDRQAEIILGMLQEKGAIDVDRQIRPWVLTRKAESKSYWRVLYDDLA
ncbi:MAG: hypothetical protein DRI57_03460 [Deltaproteobacteria bacterium]|nr:MAG: hypothetical protein DRI57_03460 [Deltaproteobacteria bacterium]